MLRAPTPSSFVARVSALSATLTALCAAAVVVGCASPRGSEPVYGVFDDGDRTGAPPRQEREPSGGEEGYGYRRSEVMAAPAAMSEAAPTSGFFDELAGDVSKAFAGGAGAPAPVAEAANGPPPPPPAPPPPMRPAPGDGKDADKAIESSEGGQAAGKRLMIYTGNVFVIVASPDVAMDKLIARTTELGGYLQSRNNAQVVVRVPADKFFAIVDELGGYGEVTAKNIEAQDVTKAVFELELHIETAEKSRARLVDLLKQANKMEDILQIEGEIRRLTGEIEQLKGQLRFFKDQVAYSTLTVNFSSSAPPPRRRADRRSSRFPWINRVGLERVLDEF